MKIAQIFVDGYILLHALNTIDQARARIEYGKAGEQNTVKHSKNRNLTRNRR